mmetsp:Transcript_14081/g.30528  ORF Transcript_14081/g.30528 Transcript_14081/m.30528 type:complete len:103 (-) Transcript_14081:141-449(-)
MAIRHVEKRTCCAPPPPHTHTGCMHISMQIFYSKQPQRYCSCSADLLMRRSMMDMQAVCMHSAAAGSLYMHGLCTDPSDCTSAHHRTKRQAAFQFMTPLNSN